MSLDDADAPASRLPTRLVTRLSNELHLSGVRQLRHLECRSFEAGIVMLVLVRLCLQDWSENGTLRPPASPRRFASLKAIARSLGRSPETIRRHARTLIEDGSCVVGPEGIAVSGDAASARRVISYLHGAHDILLRTIEDLHKARPLSDHSARNGHVPTTRIVATALDINLMPFELLREHLGDWTAMLVWGAIGTANTRPVLLDPVLNRRYAVQPTPDALRRPVSLHAVAGAIDVPYATVWRHANRMHVEGTITKRPDGWLQTQADLQRPEVEAFVQNVTRYYLRWIGTLVRSGLDPDAIAGRYIGGRPPLVPV